MSDEPNPAANAVDGTAPSVTSDTPPADTPAPEAPAASAREAVERAFAKIEQPEAEAQKPEGEGKEPKVDAAGRVHGPDGKFQAKAKDGDTPKPDASPKLDTPPKPEQKPETPPAKPAPQRFSKAAQEAWVNTPEPVRTEVERAITELTQGIEQHKAAIAAFEPIAKYAQMAEQSGTTLEDALEAYTGIETLMRTEPLKGLATICMNMGIDPRMAGRAMMEMKQLPVQAPQPSESPKVAALEAELAAIKQQLGGVTTKITEGQAQAQIDAFAKDHPYFNELEDSIAHMIETKFATDLRDAYDKAIRLNPDIAAKIEADKAAQAAPPKPQPDPAQTRHKAALSPPGAPTNGSDPSPSKPAASPREALERAFASV